MNPLSESAPKERRQVQVGLTGKDETAGTILLT
jgi:hypothetical protein